MLSIHCGPMGERVNGNGLDLGRDELPQAHAKLIALADDLYAESRSLASLARSCAALEKAERQDNGATYEVMWKLARCFTGIGDQIDRRGLQQEFFKVAIKKAEAALRHRPDRPEGYAQLATARGLYASVRLAPDRSTQEEIETPAEHLSEHFPHFESAVGHRILGGLYTQAPPWPAGVGDLESAVEVLEEAHALFPAEPLNAFFLAEAYKKSGRRKAAIAFYRKVLSAPEVGDWERIGAKYRNKTRQRLNDLASISEGGP